MQKGTSGAFNNVFVSRSADGGKTWTASLVFHAPRFTDLSNVFPALAVDPITGKVYVNTGLSTQGQGHDTVFAQIVADQLGVAPQDVIVVEGDTKAFDWGVATFASRSRRRLEVSRS